MQFTFKYVLGERESRSQQQLASRRHHTIVLKAFKRSKKGRKHEINLNTFKKAETSVLRGSLHDHEHRCASNPSTMFEEKRKRNVCFNLNLLLSFNFVSEHLFSGEYKIRISNLHSKPKQNSLVVVVLVVGRHSRKTHKTSSKLCCALEKKLIQKKSRRRSNSTKCLFPTRTRWRFLINV